MSKKTIITTIISIVAVIIIAVAVVAVLALIHHKPTASVTPIVTVKPGDPIALEKTPSYKACSVLPTDTIKAAFSGDMVNLSDGTRAGIVGLNGQPAEECNYTMSLKGSDHDTLSVQVYDYHAQTKGNDTNSTIENPDLSWSNISNITYPKMYLPTYYKEDSTTDKNSTAFYLRVIDGARNYLYTITQPDSAITLKNTDGLIVLSKLAISADYTLAAPQNAPPAPRVN